MSDTNKLLTAIQAKFGELQRERRTLNAKIDALALTYTTLTGHAPAMKPVTGHKPHHPHHPKPRARLDKQAANKTLAFLRERVRPVTVDAVMARFNIKRGAANQRLIALVRAGVAERVGPGKYRAKPRSS